MSDSPTPLTDAADYPATERSRIRRAPARAHYDRATVHRILDAAMLAHVAYAIDGQPYCTPTLHWREGEMLYWHGSSASRMLRNQRSGLPVCLTVSHLDGLVLARNGFNHSINYRSVMCFGTAAIIDDADEKARALLGVIDRFFPDRAATLRANTAQEVKATTVIGMRIEEAVAKVRAAGVGDEGEDLAHPAWAGVFPVETRIGAVQPCPKSTVAMNPMPGALGVYAEGQRLDEVMLETQALYEASHG